LLILVIRFNKTDENTRNEIYHFYLLHTSSINNWDLVDLSAPGIVGANLSAKGSDERQELYRLAESSNLWEQRIAIVSTITFIRNGEFDDTLQLAKIMMHHPHDLMHKAIGWMLREVGKRDKAVLTSFLNDYSLEMPRTMLRYAIEKFDEEERQYYLKKK
jgi:3-methyladenine DNA glycosylase AlkD